MGAIQHVTNVDRAAILDQNEDFECMSPIEKCNGGMSGETSLRDSPSEWPGTFEQQFQPLVTCTRFPDVSS